MRKEKAKTDRPVKEISKAKKIYNVISTVAVALVFLFLVITVAIMLWQRNGGKDASLFGYYTFNVVTDSMQDTINPGDVIIGKKVDPNTLQEGDIITFTAPSGVLKGNNITHRIVHVEYSDDGSVLYFNTKGDNPKVGEDNWNLSPSAVKAKYVKTSAFLGGFRTLLTKWYGYVLLIVLPLCVVFVLIITGYVKDKVAAEKQSNEEMNRDADGSMLENLSDEEKKKLLEEYLNANNKKSGGNIEEINAASDDLTCDANNDNRISRETVNETHSDSNDLKEND